MLVPDQLTRRERVRLEALNQAISMTQLIPPIKEGSVVDRQPATVVNDAIGIVIGRAIRIEKFLLDADSSHDAYERTQE